MVQLKSFSIGSGNILASDVQRAITSTYDDHLRIYVSPKGVKNAYEL